MSAPRIGFQFVPLPLNIWDDPKNHNLSLGEFRLYGYLIRHQIRLGRGIISITHDELLNGLWTATVDRQRVRWDRGCGLSRNAIKHALQALEARGWVEVDDIGDNPNVPRLAVRVVMQPEERPLSRNDAECQSVTGEWVSVTDTQLSRNDNQLSRNDNDRCHNVTPLSNTVEVLVEGKVEGEVEGSAARTKPPTLAEKTEKARQLIRESVFPYYITTIRPDSAKLYTLLPDRLAMGVKRLLECMQKVGGDWDKAEELMKIAIDTLAQSDYHMGDNPKTNGRAYNDWEILYRSADKLEWWLARSGENTYEQS